MELLPIQIGLEWFWFYNSYTTWNSITRAEKDRAEYVLQPESNRFLTQACLDLKLVPIRINLNPKPVLVNMISASLEVQPISRLIMWTRHVEIDVHFAKNSDKRNPLGGFISINDQPNQRYKVIADYIRSFLWDIKLILFIYLNTIRHKLDGIYVYLQTIHNTVLVLLGKYSQSQGHTK